MSDPDSFSDDSSPEEQNDNPEVPDNNADTLRDLTDEEIVYQVHNTQKNNHDDVLLHEYFVGSCPPSDVVVSHGCCDEEGRHRPGLHPPAGVRTALGPAVATQRREGTEAGWGNQGLTFCDA